MSPTPSKGEIREWLLDAIARELALEKAAVKTDVPLDEYGLGSVSAVAISGDLSNYLDRDFPGTLLYEYLTIDDLSSHIAGES